MKKHKKVRVLGIDYNIEVADIKNEYGSDDAGYILHHKSKIVLDINNSAGFQKCTMLHEIIEALEYRLELKLEHEQLSQIEGGLFQVMRDNPKLFKDLCDE